MDFDVESEPTVAEFTNVIGEPMYLVALCELNTPENFPYKTKKNGIPAKKQREYFEDIPTYTGKKVDYLAVDEEKWSDSNKHIVNELKYTFILSRRFKFLKVQYFPLKYVSYINHRFNYEGYMHTIVYINYISLLLSRHF